MTLWGFPSSSVGKASACNAGDPGSIPGLGRSAGEGIGCPLQYSWASLVAQLVKNPPTMQETWVWSLGCEDPLEKGKATHSSILAWRIPRIVYSPWGHKEGTWLSDFLKKSDSMSQVPKEFVHSEVIIDMIIKKNNGGKKFLTNLWKFQFTDDKLSLYSHEIRI